MSYEQYLALKQIVLEICYEQSLKLQFKRECKEVDLIMDFDDDYIEVIQW